MDSLSIGLKTVELSIYLFRLKFLLCFLTFVLVDADSHSVPQYVICLECAGYLWECSGRSRSFNRLAPDELIVSFRKDFLENNAYT